MEKSTVILPSAAGIAAVFLEIVLSERIPMKAAPAGCLLIPALISALFLALYRRYDPCGWFVVSLCGTLTLTYLVILMIPRWGLGEDSFYILVLNWAGAAAPCIAARLADRRDRLGDFRGFFRPASVVFAALYLLTLIWALFFKVGPYVGAIRSVNWAPLRTILPYLTGTVVAGRGVMVINLAANLLLFVPYGFYMNIAAGRLQPWVRAVLLAALPAVLEILQWITGRGVMDIDDFILNVLGALMGVGLYFVLEWAFRRIRRDAGGRMLTL